ncbi:hypothetical protein [Streptomyces sp. NPDC059378]|uniref:hypothetical protein n=1 Tax=Streptomyces sp. NPDC059378 TaxID=3346815 RepID=UPI0036C029AD
MARGEKPVRPPGPRGRLLTGNTHAYEADRIGFLRRCHREYGDVAGVPDLLHETVRATQPFTDSSYEFPGRLPLPRHRRFFRTVRPSSNASSVGLEFVGRLAPASLRAGFVPVRR